MNLGNRASQHNFATAPNVNIARSSFDRSFALKDTMDFDYLRPVFVDEILPGDTANVRVNMFARLATQLRPTMDNMYIDFFFFFIPSRLLWQNWEKFNGAQDNPGDSTDFVLPSAYAPTGGFGAGSLFDGMGLPTGVPDFEFTTLPFRAYNLVWNEWFRDENLQNRVPVPKDNGPDNVAQFQPLKRGKRHDYFTSALPWPQKGPSVEIGIGGVVPINTNNQNISFTAPGRGQAGLNVSFGNVVTTSNNNLDGTVLQFGNNTGLQADLSSTSLVTINQIREAFAMQSLFELDARGGTRYVEILASHFNVTSPDFRLQRPEYLGGGQVRINSQPVAQTAPSEGDSPQASLAAFGTAATKGGEVGFSKSFVEHGYVIGLACPRADITYQQGLNRMWSRQTRYDFFWPKLQDIGEQTILNKEIMTRGDVSDDIVFGYQERYAEYRFKPSEIHGKMRSTDANSLDVWHLAEEYGFTPGLNSGFIQQNTPIQRVLAVTNEPALICDYWFQYTHARPLAVRSVPAHLGRF